MNYANLYFRLRVPRTATQEQIKTAYYNLSKRFHPDRNPDDKEAAANFRHITEAYQVLGNKETRAAFDQAFAPKLNRRKAEIKTYKYESAYTYDVDWNDTTLNKRMNYYKDLYKRLTKRSNFL